MKLIDKTPFQNEQGQIDFMARLQGTLKYGPNWYAEMQAQRMVISQLEHVLEKGFVLIRNFNLPGSEVIVPFILVGTNGVSVVYVTDVKGFYEAKGDQWNRIDNGRAIATSVNLLNRVTRLARATAVYLQRQKINIPGDIESVLIGADPGLHIESLRPVARVVMSDAVKQWAGGLLTQRPVLRNEQVYDLAERIVTPRKVEAGPEPTLLPIPGTGPGTEPPASTPEEPASGAARAKAIFSAAETARPFDPTDLSFAFDDSETGGETPVSLGGSSRAKSVLDSPALKKRYLGMQPLQLGCLGAIVLVELCILAVAAYYIF